MDEIYVMKCLSGAEEYIQLNGDVSKLKVHIIKSEIQYLDNNKIVMDISDEGGMEIPDILYYEGITFVSSRFKEFMDFECIDYVFWKQADIHSEKYGIHETFWILVPPRIDCIDLDESIVNTEWDFSDGLIPMLSTDKIVIQSKMTGRFMIFKISGIMDNNIYVKKEFFEKAKLMEFEGIIFYKL